jgi:RNA polymerase sigma-70 factor (ECF subfamily)
MLAAFVRSIAMHSAASSEWSRACLLTPTDVGEAVVLPLPMDELDHLPDERIAPLALEGRRDAWNILIARHERRVLLTLLARGVRVDRARDLVQETWARLIAQQREGRLTQLELPGLAITQATYLALDDARRKRHDVPIDEAPELTVLSDPAPSVEDRLTKREELDRAIAELARCSPTARRVFELVYEDPGAPHAEAARQVGVSVQRVRQTLCEVRARLRAAMERSE